MKQSLSSVLIVLVSLFVAFSGTWFYLRVKSDSKPLKTAFQHSFLKSAHEGGRKILLLRATRPSDITSSPAVASSKYSTGVWLDVRLAGENQLVVSPGEVLPSGPQKGKPIEIASRAECKEAGLFELPDFYDIVRSRPTVLNLISRRPGLSNKILEVWGDSPPKGDKPLSLEMTAMQSESDGNLKELREAQPRGLYGSSQATLIQMEILSNLNLDGLMDLKADILITAVEEFKTGNASGGASGGVYVPRVRPATLEEAHRRGLKRYAGPARTVEAAQELINLDYDGVLVENVDVVAKLLAPTAP